MDRNTVRMILNTIFMIGAIASVIIYFAFPDERGLFTIVIMSSLVVKIVEFFIRFMF